MLFDDVLQSIHISLSTCIIKKKVHLRFKLTCIYMIRSKNFVWHNVIAWTLQPTPEFVSQLYLSTDCCFHMIHHNHKTIFPSGVILQCLHDIWWTRHRKDGNWRRRGDYAWEFKGVGGWDGESEVSGEITELGWEERTQSMYTDYWIDRGNK